MTSAEVGNQHRPVLLEETIELLNPFSGGSFIDATIGLGGHSEALLKSSNKIKVLGIDRDPDAIELARKRLAAFKDRLEVVQGNFSDILDISEGAESTDGIVADLGVSSLQLDTPERGFGFKHDAPLDMRMDPGDDSTPTAAELLETLPENEIANIIYEFGEERRSRRIARRIVAEREAGRPLQTTRQLADLVKSSVGKSTAPRHPATRTFQALRIAVNDELGILEQFVEDAISVLKPGGRLAVITFHSLEDRIIKHSFRKLSGVCSCPPRMPECRCGARKLVEILTKKPIRPAHAELEENPRARSAKLRGAAKLPNHQDET